MARHMRKKLHDDLQGSLPDNYRGNLNGLSLCFDLDGTLVHTAPDLVRVTNDVIALEGLPETDYHLAAKAVGFGSRHLISAALSRSGHQVSNERLDELQRLFLLRYASDIAQLSQPYPGVIETLMRLRHEGAALSVCTNKPGWLARPLLDALNMTQFFESIVGGDEAPRKKPDPRHIFMSAGHRDRARIVMIGDSWPDMRAAHNARVFSILVTYGYADRPHQKLRADVRLRTFRQLTPALRRWYCGPH